MRSDESDRTGAWALRICVAVVFALTGIEKLLPGAAQEWFRTFDAIGFGQWFRYFTGIVEAVGGLMFLVPASTTVGAALLAATMIGAMATQAFVLGHPVNIVLPGIYLAGVVVAFLKLRASTMRIR
jgi:putative oxidoreductase